MKVRALRAVGRAGLDVGRWGEAIGQLDVARLDLILITGDDRLVSAEEQDLREIATSVGIRVAFDVPAFRRTLSGETAETQHAVEISAVAPRRKAKSA